MRESPKISRDTNALAYPEAGFATIFFSRSTNFVFIFFLRLEASFSFRLNFCYVVSVNDADQCTRKKCCSMYANRRNELLEI